MRVARRGPAGAWTIDDFGRGGLPSLAHAGDSPCIGFSMGCRAGLERIRLACDAVAPDPSELHRGVVLDPSPGWHAAALPLTSLNDDPSGGFPAPAPGTGSYLDATPPAVPLVLYRRLLPPDVDTGNVLRAVKIGAGVAIRY